MRSIRTRILAVFVLSLAAFTGALGYGLVQLRAIGESLDAVDTGYLPLAGVANELDVVARLISPSRGRIALEEGRTPQGRRSDVHIQNTRMSEVLRAGRETATRARDQLPNPQDRMAMDAVLTVLDEIDTLRAEYLAAFEAWSAAVEQGGPESAEATRTFATLERKGRELVVKVGLLSGLTERQIEIVAAQTARAQTRAYTVGGALAAIAIALSGLLVAVALFTLRPIGQLTEQVQRLGAGDYAGRVDVPSGDEVGTLAREFNAMAEAVSERDRRLKERAEALDRLSEHLRKVLDTIHAGLVVVEEGQAGMCNPAAERLWEVTQGGAIPAGIAGLEPGRHEAHRIGSRLFDFEVAPFGDHGALVVGEDVTERIRDRERLARSERLALVGQMLAQITHEVRNPLNALSLNAELLAEDLADSDQRVLMETITGEIARLEQLTARYLELSRGRRPELTPCDPSDLVREVVRVDGPVLERAGVASTVQAGPAGVADIDADALRRALRNVLRNAAESGATRVEVLVERHPGEVRVRVRDDGPGLDQDQARRVFEPFFTTKARGTGLGLAISRQELEDVGGFIRCTSSPGEGSTFTLGLPVAE